MLPDMYTLEKLALEHHQQLFREAEHERLLAMADSPKHASHALQRFAGKRATFLYKTENSLSSALKHLRIIASLAHRRAIGG